MYEPSGPPGRSLSWFHRRVTLSIKFASTHLYTWVERGTVGVKCLAQEHNTMSPSRTQTWTARSGDERTNHEATMPPSPAKDIQHLLQKNSFFVLLEKLIKGVLPHEKQFTMDTLMSCTVGQLSVNYYN